jgi:small GTP-binding protein
MSRPRESIGCSSLNQNEEKPLEVKLVILGKSLVGKSALTFRFINAQFPKDHDTTIEDSYKVKMNIGGTNCLLEILDTAGQDDYQSMLDTWINFGSGFLLVYSIDDLESYEEVKKKYEKVALMKSREIFSCILVGNKCDLSDDLRKVEKSDAQEFADSKGIPFLEASALNRTNVNECFNLLVLDLLDKLKEKVNSGCMAKGCGCNIS